MIVKNVGTAGTNQYDNGSCCGKKVGSTQLNVLIAKISGSVTAVTAGNADANKWYNAWSCVAFSNVGSCTGGSPCTAWQATFANTVVDIVTTA